MNVATSNKTLILLTKTFPFGVGEQYIENELEYLANVFEKIIIYPNDYYSKDTTHPRILPDNVEVLNLNQDLEHFKKKGFVNDVFFLVSSTLFEFFSTDDKGNFLKNFKWNLINFWTQLQISKVFSKYLRDNGYNSKNAIFYSYWFHKSAILLSVLRAKHSIEKYVSRAHSIDLYHQDWGFVNQKVKVPPFKMFKLKHTNKILPISEHGSNYLKKKYPSISGKIFTYYLGVKDQAKNDNRKQLDYFHIVTCSSIDANKRIHKLAEALANIQRPVRWTHFGNGDLLYKVEEFSKYFPKEIVFDLKGKTPNELVHQFYGKNHVDLFVNLSIVEGLPVSIMEAMQYGIAILATSVYGTPEAVIEGENGFLLNVNFSVEALTQKINECIENKSLLAIMGDNSRKVFDQKFNAEKNYSHFANYLTSL